MSFSRHALSLLFLTVLVLTPAVLFAQTDSPTKTSTLRGRIVDSESRAPLGQVEIVVVGTALRAYTGDDGRFVLENLASGTHRLSVTRLGYSPLRREVVIGEVTPPELELPLVRTAVPLQEVVVTPGSFAFMGRGTGVRQTMSRDDVEAVPQIGNDIFRAVNRLPGLSSNDYEASFGIRGGRHDETLILLDGLELYEPYHLKDFNEGAISIVDSKTIDGVQLMTGGFPARYGNRRSGVFEVTSRTPDSERTLVDVGASFLNSHALAMGPFANGNGSWLAFGRAGYMGLVFQLIDQGDLPQPRYHDVFAKARYALSPKHRLAFDVLHASDRYQYEISSTTGFADSIPTVELADTDYQNQYAWATLESSLGARTNVRTIVSAGEVEHARAGSERAIQLASPYYTVSNQRRFTILGASQDWTYGLTDRDLVSFGADFRRLRVTDAVASVVERDPDDPSADPDGEFPIRTNTNQRTSGAQLALYVSNRLRVATPLVVETGVRFDRADWTGDRDFSPRASAALDLGRGMTLRLGWGLYRQVHAIEDVASFASAAGYSRSERSDQWTAGWERIGSNGALVRLEGYDKRGSRLRPVFRNWKGAVDPFPESNEDRVLVFPRESSSRGVEVYFDQPIGKSLSARASYAYSIAEETVDRIVNVNSSEPLAYDRTHPIPQDQRHAANADFTWRLSSYVLNGSFAWHTGWPATLEQLVPVINEDGEAESAARPVKLYAERFPDYMRFDLRASRSWATRWGDWGASLEVINVTNHENVFGYDYFRRRADNGSIVLDRGDETWFTILPSLGVTWTQRF